MNLKKDDELREIYGGTSISGTVINAFVDLIEILYEAGRSAGSSIRRMFEGDLCPLK